MFTFNPLYSSLLLEESRGGYFQFRLSLPACVQWELKNFLKYMLPAWALLEVLLFNVF